MSYLFASLQKQPTKRWPTDQEFTLSELEDVLHRLKDTAPGDDTVCNAMIKNMPLATKYLLPPAHQPVNSQREKLPTRWKMAKIIPIPKKDGTQPSYFTTSGHL